MSKCKNAMEAHKEHSRTFFTGKPCKHGHISPRDAVSGVCIECRREQNLRRYYEKSTQEPDKERAKRAQNRRRHRKNNPILGMYNHVKSSAKKRQIEFTIQKEDIDAVAGPVCPILGVQLIYAGEETDDNWGHWASLDRIDNTKGYVRGNIAVISKLANTLKSQNTPETLFLLMRFINTHYEKQQTII